MVASSTLRDGFQDNFQNPALWTNGYFEFAAAGSTVAESGQTVDVTLLGNTGGTYYNGFLSISSYDMTGDAFYAKLITAPNVATAAEGVFAAYLDANNAAAFIISGATIAARSRLAGSNANVASVTYVPTTHAWLRIREAGGTTFWDTAPATASNPPVGGDWVNLTSAVNFMTMTALKACIGGGVYNADIAPGHAVWDGFNGATTQTNGDTGGSTYTLTAAQGSYALTGQTANLLENRILTAVQGSYALTGQTAALSYSTASVLTAIQGSYSLIGSDALVDTSFNADFGSYTLTGFDATLVYTPLNNYTVTAVQGSYTLTGFAVNLLENRVLTADKGQYNLTGQFNTMIWSGAPVVVGGQNRSINMSKLRIGL